MTDVIILGGGWAGLSSAYHIKRQKPDLDVLVLESQDKADRGGLLRSEKINGFTFDLGGPHILFSRNIEILSEIVSFLGRNVGKHARKSFIFYDGRYIPYPFENGIYVLEPEKRANIGLGIIQSMMKVKENPAWHPNTFRDWMYELFGDAMAMDYLDPYNRKIWKRDLTTLDTDWVFSPGRLPYPELKDIVRSIAGVESIGYKEQSGFFYPKYGGIQSLYDSLIAIVKSLGVKVSMSTLVSKVKRNKGSFIVNDAFQTRNILNTLPPSTFASILDDGGELGRVAEKFDYNRVVVVGIAYDGESPYQHAIYVPDPNIVFHRFTWMNNLTSDTPKGKSNLIAEITVPHWENCNLKAIRERTIKDLITIGAIKSIDKILFSRVWINEFGYPVYIKDHNKTREEFFQLLRLSGIYSVGRWGSWHYWNTDKVFEAAKSETSRLISDSYASKDSYPEGHNTYRTEPG